MLHCLNSGEFLVQGGIRSEFIPAVRVHSGGKWRDIILLSLFAV